MTDTVKAVPQGFHTLTPHLTVRDAERAIDFYQKAFGAEVLVKHYGSGGSKVIHASLKIGDSILMLNDEFPEWGLLSPLSTGGAGVTIHVYLENVDAAFARVVSAGAEVKMPLMDAYWGARYGQVQDPFGIDGPWQREFANCPRKRYRKRRKLRLPACPRAPNTPAGFASPANCSPWGRSPRCHPATRKRGKR